MKPIKDEIRNELAGRFGINGDELSFLAGGREDSDGIVYTVLKHGEKYVFKISQASDEEHVKNVLEFTHYLGKCGIQIGSPIANQNGNIYEKSKDNDTLLIATLMEYIDGYTPDADVLQKDTQLIYEWGKLTGKMHNAAKKYPIWRNVCENDERYGFEAEIDSFIRMSPNEFIREKWQDMKERLRTLPINRDTYGFIHNDNHQMNIIVSGTELSVIDFDCAECHFFVNDILLPVQGLLFDVSGGMMNPVSKPEVLRDFYKYFLAGYQTENALDPFWFEQLGTFLEYRRLLLYTVLQGWLSNDKGADEAFLSMIEHPCEIPAFS